ncbi:MAG: glycoside hydrolase family 127 protein [Chloroflexota bacterium]
MHTPLPFTAVSITDAFWAPRLRVNREKTLPIEYRQLKETGRIDAFRLAWKPGDPNPPHIFWDSDVAKWLEAASYAIATHPDPALDALMDEVIALIAGAQQPDGYLNVHFTAVEPEKRWMNLRDAHELYCAGHLIEAAVAHFQATGKRTLLDVLRRYADYIATVFGRAEGQKRGYPGHEEIELALVKLARITGESRYRHLARYFVDERGQPPNYFAVEHADDTGVPLPFGPIDAARFDYGYNQSHQPVREQREVRGHAVRAMYLYAAMADLALDDATLQPALDALWDDVCTRKMYVTGGIGPSRHNEGFTTPYDLPNESAYAETCAAIGLVFWNQRLLQKGCEARYADVLERALYNGAISGVSLDGEKFFYENPLASSGAHHRQPWFDCACCPPNLARLLASLGEYVYTQGDDEVAVHLYVQGSAQVTFAAGGPVTIQQETRYPWDGLVQIGFEMERATRFGLRLRVPGWCQHYHLFVNDKPVKAALEDGYLVMAQEWQPDDVIRFEMVMPVERVYAHPNIRQDAGQVALQRGPLVYCIEQVDHCVPIEHIVLPADAVLYTRFEPELLGGVTVIHGEALAADPAGWQGLYRTNPPRLVPTPLLAIPYYAWDNRQPGAMRVWLNAK